MVFGGIVTSPRSALSPAQALELANIYLTNAHTTNDASVSMVLCHDTEVSLSQAKRAAKNTKAYTVRDGIAVAYIKLGKLLDHRGNHDEAQICYGKAEKLGGRLLQQQGRLIPYPDPNSNSSSALDSTLGPLDVIQSSFEEPNSAAVILQYIFTENITPPTIVSRLPAPDERLSDTIQLACCLFLMQDSVSPDDILDPATLEWIQAIENDQFEQERLKIMATDVLRVFKRDELKDSKAVAEVIYLAPVLEKDEFQSLLKEIYSGIAHSDLLDIHQLDGLAQLIQGADPGHLDADDLIKILTLLSTRLRDTHYQSSLHMYQLTVAVSRVLDAMADTNVKDLDREKLHEPLSSYLEGLKDSADPCLVYQAAYAYQALLYVPDNETLWQSALRRTGKVIRGVLGLVKAVKGFDLNGFIEGLRDIQQGLEGVPKVMKQTPRAIERAISVVQSGQGFVDSLKEGLDFHSKRDWYPALRLADALLRDGQFATFKQLVCEAPCRNDAVFLWGVCQRLGDVAADPTWDTRTHQSAIEFLGAIYRNDVISGQQAGLKQWIVILLMRLSSSPEKSVKLGAETLLQELESNADAQERLFFQVCRKKGTGSCPLRVTSIPFASPSLLERAQNKPDVEGHLRHLMKQRLKEETRSVYIPPQAKAGLHVSDNTRFSLMDKVNGFLANDQKVFLLLGDSGAGKSTFNRALECDLWQAYKKGRPIPLHINLPAIDKPDQDMIAKQLRRSEFTESQIRELKVHRKFILICDGYDECQQTHNLYTTNRLNQPGEWQAQMLISCRTEYLGTDYLDRFQPGDRNMTLKTNLLQEAVITPFSVDQIEAYIDQYITIHQPLWEAKEYKQALDQVPSLRDLVRNPFLMSLSLEVLPRMMDPGQGLLAARITKVALYDQFVEHWLERGKKRLGEKALGPQARAAFESLSDEGFTKNGIDFLKKLSVAIYKEQDGHPIIEYTRYKDEGSWKAEFFTREDRQLLREACPLARNGNHHRFIHRSILEYGLARAIFDPQEYKERTSVRSSLNRRGSTSSVWSFENRGGSEAAASVNDQEPDINSPLVWRSFVNDQPILQFLEERVHQKPAFKQQLLDYIEYSKRDKKWRTAAANAITILVRLGVEFRFANLQGIRIPGADLSNGVFESSNLQGADLRKVNLRNVWLRGSNLNRSQMAGVQFGELPSLKHGRNVSSWVYSPDGQSLAVGLGDGTILMYATSNWETTWTSKCDSNRIVGLAYSPSGDQIASDSSNYTVRLWDVATGRCRQTFCDLIEEGMYRPSDGCVAFSAQGDSVASGSRAHIIRLWDAETGKCRHVLYGHTDHVCKVVCSPKGDTVASCSWDMTARLWDVTSGICLYTLSGHTGRVTSIIFSLQGDLVASASEDDTVRIWEVETGECRHNLTGHTLGIKCIAFSPKGNRLASGGHDETVRLWNVEAGTCIHVLSSRSAVHTLEYSPQGDLVASNGFDKTVQLWDTDTGECCHTLTGHVKAVQKVLFSPKGDHISSASEDGAVRQWNVEARTSRMATNSHSKAVSRVMHSSKRHQIASCSQDGTIRLWDAGTGANIHTLTGHSGAITSFAYSPRGGQIVSCSEDNTIRLWNVEDGACCHILTGHTRQVSDVEFSPSGGQIASASEDSTVRLWNVKTGACQHVLAGHSGNVTKVVYSPQGDLVASTSGDPTVQLWNVEIGACRSTLVGHTLTVTSVVYSPNGSQIATSSWDGTVRLWSAAKGKCDHVLSHSTFVEKVVFSPEGSQLASVDANGVVKLWDVPTANCRHTFTSRGVVDSIAFSPRGNLILSSSHEEVRLWDTATGERRWGSDMTPTSAGDWESSVVAWIASDTDSFVTGGRDGSVRVWDVIEEEGQCRVRMRWRSTTGHLNVEDVCIQDVEGLSHLNKRLLEQRRAVGEPMLETGKMVTAMGSVVSRFMSSLTRKSQDYSGTGVEIATSER